jgi:hypothetical protein
MRLQGCDGSGGKSKAAAYFSSLRNTLAPIGDSNCYRLAHRALPSHESIWAGAEPQKVGDTRPHPGSEAV